MGIGAALRERTVRGVTRHVRTATGEQELLAGVSRRLQPAVPHAASAWLVTDPSTLLFTDGWVNSFSPATCMPWFENELHTDDVHKFAALTPGRPAVLSRREDRSGSARWSQIMRPQGLDDELRMTAADNTGCWATIELHREVGAPDFAPDDADLLAELGPVVAGGLRRLALERAAGTAQVEPDGPGLLHVLADGTPQPVTAAGAAWLELIEPANDGHQHSSLLTLAAMVRAPSSDDRPRRLNLRTRDGRWVTLHASRMLDGRTTAVIVEPARPTDLTDLIARAHGLTPRELDVALAVSRGRSTAEIASVLFLSPHTVRDHLKAAFAKVGVGSRAELVAALFNRHYADDFFDRVGAG